MTQRKDKAAKLDLSLLYQKKKQHKPQSLGSPVARPARTRDLLISLSPTV